MSNVPEVLGDGRFTLTRLLGEGGMAEVWECYDHTIEIARAIKFLNADLARRTTVLRRFISEGHALARIQHPNVVRVFDVGEAGGRPYLLLELASGGSLADYIARHGPMEPRLAVDCLLQVCRGIEAAHAQGIIHRDIKPDNILVDGKGTCKLTDFGIAQFVDSSSYTRTGSSMGTISYMAPEQRTDAKNISATVDVYALGATLFALVTGNLPGELFVAEHHPHLLDELPEPLRAAVLGATPFEPDKRFPSPEHFANALTQALTQLPEAPPDTPPLVELQIATGPVPIEDNATPPTAPDTSRAPAHAPHAATEEPVAEEAGASTEPEVEWLSRGTALALVATTLLLLISVPTVVLGAGIYVIGTAASAAEQAEQDLYTTIDAESGVLDDLTAIRGDTSEARRLLETVHSANGPARLEAAKSYLITVRTEVETRAPRAPAQAEQRARLAIERVERINAAFALQRDRHATWTSTSRKGLGATVCSIGLGRCPR